MDSDYDTGHGLPTDFPSDPNYGGLWFTGGLCSLLLLALIIAAVMAFLRGSSAKRRDNYDEWPRSLAGFVRGKAREVVHANDEGAAASGFIGGWFGARAVGAQGKSRRNARDIDPARAALLPWYVDRLLGRNIALGEAMNKQIKGLSDALDGFKDIKDAVPAPGAPAAGGTVINIAVNQTGPNGTSGDPVQTLGGPYSGAAVAGGAPGYVMPEPVEIGKNANIWMAYNRFREDWDQPDVMATFIRSAQNQLYTRPPEPPRT